jgi:hypothetical protein
VFSRITWESYYGDANSVIPKQVLETCISNNLPGDIHTAGLGTNFYIKRLQVMFRVWTLENNREPIKDFFLQH